MAEQLKPAHRAALDVAIEDLDAAAQPTKSEVFVACGAHAADLRDAIKAALALIPAVSAERPGLVTALKGLMDEWHRQAEAYENDSKKSEPATGREMARAYSALLDRVASDLKLTITCAMHGHPAPVKAETAREFVDLHLAAAYLLKGAERGSWGFTHNGRQARLVAHYVDDSAVPATPEGPKEQGSSQSQPVLSPKSDNAAVTSPGETAPPARWQTMDRSGLIDTARNWADRQMAIHDAKDGMAATLKDQAFGRADALYEFAAHIEDGNFDAARPSSSEGEDA